MSELDKAIKSLTATQKMIDCMSRNPFSDFAKQQEQLFKTASVMASIFKPYQTTAKIFEQPLLQFHQQLASMWQPSFDSLTATKIQCYALAEPYQRMQKLLNESFYSAFAPLANNTDFYRQAALIQESVNSMASLFQEIHIHKNYVSVPEELIPDDFQCEEVTVEPEKTALAKTTVKHLSYSNTLALLAIIIPFLCWIISCIREDISSRQEQLRHEEIVAVQKETNRLQEEENQIRQKQLEATENQVACLYAIYQQLQESDSAPSEIDSCSRCDPLQSESSSLPNPTGADDSGNSDMSK